MIEPRDQWLTLYSYTAPVHNEQGAKLLPPTFGPIEGEPEHLQHPDLYSPDRRTAIAAARRVADTGLLRLACGKEIDPRLAIHEEEKNERVHCAGCYAATTEAAKQHAAIIEERKAAAAKAET